MINFIYKNSVHNIHKESIVKNIYNSGKKILKLPENITIIFQYLGENVYGNSNLLSSTEITLNSNLSIRELPIVLVHELIHCEQHHLKKLKILSQHVVSWDNIRYNIESLSYDEYKNLPWEVDVNFRLEKVLKNILTIANNNLTS